jgi:uncharacterized protein DUF6516
MKKKTARAKQKRPAQREKRIDDTSYLTGKRRGAVLKEEVWYEGQRVVKYSLAYINPMVFGGDNGRVLGYDNSHDYHHRHFGGQVEEIQFAGYERLVDRFQQEVEDLWRIEDEEKA